MVLIAVFNSCREKQVTTVTDVHFIDSLFSFYSISPLQKINAANIEFWKNKLAKAPVGYIEAQQYAAALSSRFALYSDIKDIRAADSILHWLNIQYKEKDAGLLRTLTSYAITQHKFHDAANYIQKALAIGSDKNISEMLNFDAAFELGQTDLIRSTLDNIKSANEYGYFFRLSKYEHLQGRLDSSIAAMQKALDLAGGNTMLQQIAVSNMADLYMHAAEPGKANELYMESIRLDAADLHSLSGIGWIALMHDKKDTLAENIFRFIQSKTKSPDILLKLEMVAEQRSDSNSAKKYAVQFVHTVSDSAYGNMNNKYLIDLYTGILNDPGKAVSISSGEIFNRATPQTYSWYAWSLYKNGQATKAFELYNKYVSGKPLEGLELYYMGMMMQGIGKGYNAQQYFKAAYKNRYDLGPAKLHQLEEQIAD